MFRIISIFLAAAAVFLWSRGLAGEATQHRGKIGVVRSQFDRVENLLTRYRIPHDLLSYPDLEKKETLTGYETIFFPCGVNRPVEADIDVYARGFYVHRVLLKRDSPKVDRQKISDNIGEFIRNGGSGYFSDFSYDLVQGAFGCFEFHHDFPNLGMPGVYRADLHGQLYRFARRKTVDMTMTHSGWVLLRSVSDARVLAEGLVETPRGEMKGPLVMMMNRGDGELIYTSYHSDSAFDETMRFAIYRLSMKGLQSHHMKEIRKWNQSVRDEVFDSLLPGEPSRSYFVTLARGRNTIYFYAEKGVFQVDLFDRELNLVISRDAGGSVFSMDVRVAYDGDYTLSVYSTGDSYHNPYSVVAASGWRLIPYVTAGRVIIVLVVLFAAAVLVTAFQIAHPRKIGGRIRT
jgi:hypothetical protein